LVILLYNKYNVYIKITIEIIRIGISSTEEKVWNWNEIPDLPKSKNKAKLIDEQLMKQDLYITYIDVPENNDVLSFKLLYYDEDKCINRKKD
jgi:hypothetical protein